MASRVCADRTTDRDAVSYLITLAVLLALPLTMLGALHFWVGLLEPLSGDVFVVFAGVPFFSIPVLAYVLGRVWGRRTTPPLERGTTVWPAVLTLWAWWVLAVVVLVWRLGPALAASVGAPSRGATFAETLMYARPMIVMALVLTAGAAFFLVRTRRERVPSGRTAVWSVALAVLMTVVIPFARDEMALRGQEAVARRQVARIQSSATPEQIPRELVKLSELRGGDLALRRIADDPTTTSQLRAHVVGRLLEMGRNGVDRDDLRRAEAILRTGSEEERLIVVNGCPFYGWSDEVRPFLRMAAGDPDPRVRAHAAWKLRVIGRKDDRQMAYDVLAEVLEHRHDYPTLDLHTVQCSLYLRALVRDETATRILEDILSDPAADPEHRKLAQIATEHLSSTKDSKGYVTPPYALWNGCPGS
jgi:hypothetical protein